MYRGAKDRIKKAEDKALEKLEYILQSIPAPDFVEIIGRIGGHTISCQVYDDGSIYERRRLCGNMKYSGRYSTIGNSVEPGQKCPVFLCSEMCHKRTHFSR